MRRLALFPSLVMLAVLLPINSFAQSPGWSRGQQLLTITYDECVRRASQALQADGHNIDYAAGAFAVGRKDVHTSVIMCNAAADGKQWANIVVASNGEGGGAVRERLQALMERPAPVAQPVPPASSSETILWDISVKSRNPGACTPGARFTYTCSTPADPRSVWGTDVYTHDSSICTAAVHAGLATVQDGGTFTLEVLPGQSSYTGSTRNGIVTGSYPSWDCSYRFVSSAKAQVQPLTQKRPVTGYLGCFKDTSAFDLNGYLERSALNTPARCVEICRQRGFAFAAVQYGESCLCGNSYGKYGAATNCNMPCTGDANQTCGGYTANSVFGTGVSPP